MSSTVVTSKAKSVEFINLSCSYNCLRSIPVSPNVVSQLVRQFVASSHVENSDHMTE